MLWYSLEAPCPGSSNKYPQHRFSWRNMKNIFQIPLLNCSYGLLNPLGTDISHCLSITRWHVLRADVMIGSYEARQTKYLVFYITKTHLYNFGPLKPHFYIVKLGFTWVYIISLILLKITDCGYSVELVLVSTYNLCFQPKYEKYQNFSSENFPFLIVKLCQGI